MGCTFQNKKMQPQICCLPTDLAFGCTFTSIDLDALTGITETSESNTVDRGSTLLQSGPLNREEKF